jgi:tetratricopeptide (TPR) repeat protein
LIRKISDLGVKQTEREIAALEESVANNAGDTMVLAEKNSALAAAKKRRAEMLIEEARKRVERNPTDLQFRFELGEHLMNAGHFREGLPELQRARQNPNARLKAMNALGRCYRELGMFDLAARQLEEAAREIATMDATKKEIVYNLGLVYERMGNREKSLACMKQIYEADYGYKDVATRVESSYAAGS